MNECEWNELFSVKNQWKMQNCKINKALEHCAQGFAHNDITPEPFLSPEEQKFETNFSFFSKGVYKVCTISVL